MNCFKYSNILETKTTKKANSSVAMPSKNPSILIPPEEIALESNLSPFPKKNIKKYPLACILHFRGSIEARINPFCLAHANLMLNIKPTHIIFLTASITKYFFKHAEQSPSG